MCLACFISMGSIWRLVLKMGRSFLSAATVRNPTLGIGWLDGGRLAYSGGHGE
jgi:hypothetical protein